MGFIQFKTNILYIIMVYNKNAILNTYFTILLHSSDKVCIETPTF